MQGSAGQTVTAIVALWFSVSVYCIKIVQLLWVCVLMDFCHVYK